MNNQINQVKDINPFLRKLVTFKKHIIGSVVFIILILIGILIFKNQEEKKNIKISENFNKAVILIEDKNLEKATEILKLIVQEKNKFYSINSLNLIIQNNLIVDNNEIKILFKELYKIKNIGNELKDLIKIKELLYFQETINEQEILDKLKNIMMSESIWKKTAIKIVKQYYISKGQLSKFEQFIKQ